MQCPVSSTGCSPLLLILTLLCLLSPLLAPSLMFSLVSSTVRDLVLAKVVSPRSEILAKSHFFSIDSPSSEISLVPGHTTEGWLIFAQCTHQVGGGRALRGGARGRRK